MGLVHTVGIARFALLIGRAWRSGLARPLGAPGERQSDQEGGDRSPPVHLFPQELAGSGTPSAHKRQDEAVGQPLQF